MSKTADFAVYLEKLFGVLEERILPSVTAISEHRHLRALRDGIVVILPMIIIGSLFLLLGQLPVNVLPAEWQKSAAIQWYLQHTNDILLPYRLTMGIMALFAAFGIGFSLAKSYNMDGLSSGILSSAAFITANIPQVFKDTGHGWSLSISKLGGEGLFVAILMAMFTVEATRFLEEKNITIKMPESVPPAVSKAFSSIIPGLVVIGIIWVFSLFFSLQKLIYLLFSPLVLVGDTLVAVILINLLTHILWIAGIHGVSVINAVALAIWMSYLQANADAHAAGLALPYITTMPFYQWFIWIGGSGSTLALSILMLRSKSVYIKKLGKMAIIPGICNINEPIIFGLPIVMNPLMAIPFIIAPLVCGLTAYLAIAWGLVNRPYLLVPWTLPAPIGGWLCTGFDWRAIVLVLVNFVLAGLIYYPFLKVYEKKKLEEEKEEA